jgi:DNA-binding IclR family transcriptional regulator
VPASQVVGLVRGSGVGYTAPAYCTGVGKAMLAFLSPEELDKFFAMTQLVALTPHTLHTRADLEASLRRARRKGYATDNEEHEPGVACIGAPILGRRGEVVAAISVAGPVSRMKQHLRDSKSGGRLCEVASTMSGLLGHGKGA